MTYFIFKKDADGPTTLVCRERDLGDLVRSWDGEG
jgi:hypothetical protein